jgi:hypothetical protein
MVWRLVCEVMVVQLFGILERIWRLIRDDDDDDDDDEEEEEEEEEEELFCIWKQTLLFFLNLRTSRNSPIACYIDINVLNTKLGSRPLIPTPKLSFVLIGFI